MFTFEMIKQCVNYLRTTYIVCGLLMRSNEKLWRM